MKERVREAHDENSEDQGEPSDPLCDIEDTVDGKVARFRNKSKTSDPMIQICLDPPSIPELLQV